MLPSSALASRQYRCNGRIQYRPCEVPAANAASPTPNTSARQTLGSLRRAPSNDPAIPGLRYAKVHDTNFQRLGRRDGLWRGLVKGNGTVHLTLVLKRGDTVIDERYMGNVTLLDRETTFAFRSVLPTQHEWDWDISASAS
jgi:hypothetical protein